MNFDCLGQPYFNSDEIVELLYKNPNLNLENFLVEDPDQYNKSLGSFYLDLPRLKKYFKEDYKNIDVQQFDKKNQASWFMPNHYQTMDIRKHVISLCKTPQEKLRVITELKLFEERNLIDLLKFLHYLVDVLRSNKIVWGVGRGSSVASYVLYLLGVHRIDSLKFNLDIGEFLKDE